MFGHKYYFGTIRKYIILFGTLFNDIFIDRVDKNGNLLKTIKVPVNYGPRERYLTRLEQNPDLLRQIDMLLPRIAFEITNIRYAEERKLNSIGKNKALSPDLNSFYTQYNPVPYDFDITLSIMTRNADDGTRIVEQILPFFKPEWTATVNVIPDMGIKMDIPVVIKSVNLSDTYESNFESRRAITWTLTFTLKGYLFGPISKTGVIKDSIVNFYIPTTNTAAEGVGITPAAETISITPGLTANGQPTSNAAASIPVDQISANSNYGFIVDFQENL